MKKWVYTMAVLISSLFVGIGFSNSTQTVHAADQITYHPGYKSVFAIDAGRKYINPTQLKAIIAKAADDGYTDVELILGNDGLRFVLDDMSVTANGKTYSSADVTKAVKQGNQQYYDDPNGNYLTETQLNDLLTYAQSRGVGIIPVIESPGHMDAILNAMKLLGIDHPQYSTSARTVDLNNAPAMAFTQALLTKYIHYFAGKATIFNLGCDEYANDATNAQGWRVLQQSGDYSKFIDYVNTMAKTIEASGMQPMVFNDGVYYNSDTSFGTFDKNFLISYWTVGWNGYDVAKPDFLVKQGFKLFNTNDGWYFVLGRLDKTNIYNLPQATENLKKLAFTDTPGGTADTPIEGSVQVVWADDPSADLTLDKILNYMDDYSAAYAGYLIKPADYQAVDAALKDVPAAAQLSNYTPESVAKLQSATQAVVRCKRANEQAVVDGYAVAIKSALAGLQLRGADYTQLNALVARAKALSPDHYTNYSAVAKALSQVKYNLDITHQAEVNQMAQALNTAIAQLQVKKAPATSKKPVATSKTKVAANKVAHPRTAQTNTKRLPRTGEQINSILRLSAAS